MKTRRIVLFTLFFVYAFIAKAQDTNTETDYLVTINTEYGKIKLILFDDTPLHKENFITLAKAGVYDHIIFHRVINRFMIQTGDFTTRNQPTQSYRTTVTFRSCPQPRAPHSLWIRLSTCPQPLGPSEGHLPIIHVEYGERIRLPHVRVKPVEPSGR